MTKGESGARHDEVIRASATPQGDEPLAILRRAMHILTGVSRLLEALSPDDIQAMATRLHRGVERQQDAHAVYWRVYEARHRVLMEVFSTQHAELAGWARAYMDVVHAAGERREHP
jgi:predicted component of type VI protein secretion system